MSIHFNPDAIRALCHRNTPREDLIAFDKILSRLSYHRAADFGEATERRNTFNEAMEFILEREWGFDHIEYFFMQGGASYLATADEFQRAIIARLYARAAA